MEHINNIQKGKIHRHWRKGILLSIGVVFLCGEVAHAQPALGYGSTKSEARKNAWAVARANCGRKNLKVHVTGDIKYGQYPDGRWEARLPYMCSNR